MSKFQDHYPGWKLTRDVRAILGEIHDYNRERWLAGKEQRGGVPRFLPDGVK